MDTQKGLIPDCISTLLWVILLAILGLGATSVIQIESSRSPVTKGSHENSHPATIFLEEGAEKVLTPEGVAEAPSLSPDGSALVYVTTDYKDDILGYEIDSAWLARPNRQGIWQATLVAKGHRTFFGEMATFFNPSFDHVGNDVITGRARFWNLFSIPIVSTVKSGLNIYSLSRGQTEQLASPSELGMPHEILQHPKVSPDGKWLTFYTRRKKETRGIYLLQLKTKKVYRLSSEDDKHPTWSPDGRYLFFHYQRGGDALDPVSRDTPEQAYLGYFELTFSGDSDVSWRRFLIDPVTDSYTYHKHPAQIPGTNLLFFHGRLSPRGPHLLMVRHFGIKTPVYVVTPMLDSKAMKEIKHAANAVDTKDLFFLGKASGEKFYSFYRLTPSGLRTIQEAMR